MTSFREIAQFMDPINTPKSIRELANIHRWVDGRLPTEISFREITTRHTNSRHHTYTLLFYNTYLLPVLELIWINVFSAPELGARAKEIGKVLFQDYLQQTSDNSTAILALCELWDNDQWEVLFSELSVSSKEHIRQGPDDAENALFDISVFDYGLDAQVHGAGLATVVFPKRIAYSAKHMFDERGRKKHDADYFSNKGVLLSTINTSTSTSIEVYSTHLFNGGFKETPSFSQSREEVKFKQVDELINFVKRHHQSKNIAIIVGDFNLDRHETGTIVIDGQRDTPYKHLMRKLQFLHMIDLWEDRNGTLGYTNSLVDKSGICIDDPRSVYCDDAEYTQHTDRIDYIFVESAKKRHEISIDFVRPRRRSFPRRVGADGYNEIPFMSDHIGLEVKFISSPT